MANGWRGCSDVFMRSNGAYSDPDLVIEKDGDTYVFNYWDIESALWEDFLAQNGIEEQDTYDDVGMGRGRYHISDEWEQKFNEYCQINAYDYMVDCIYSGYFGSYDFDDENTEWDPYDEEYTWHYSYRKDEDKAMDEELRQLADSWYAGFADHVTRKGKVYYFDGNRIGDIYDLIDYIDTNFYDED